MLKPGLYEQVVNKALGHEQSRYVGMAVVHVNKRVHSNLVKKNKSDEPPLKLKMQLIFMNDLYSTDIVCTH
jgi:hypothetical protein